MWTWSVCLRSWLVTAVSLLLLCKLQARIMIIAPILKEGWLKGTRYIACGCAAEPQMQLGLLCKLQMIMQIATITKLRGWLVQSHVTCLWLKTKLKLKSFCVNFSNNKHCQSNARHWRVLIEGHAVIMENNLPVTLTKQLICLKERDRSNTSLPSLNLHFYIKSTYGDTCALAM